MKQRVYLETTIVSYLVARPSRDLVLAAHQEVTREWWERRRKDFELEISQFVLNEAAGGDPAAAKARLALLKGLRQLPVTGEVTELGRVMVTDGVLPPKASIDALHVAVASVHESDVLLTWNCRHLANAELLGELGRYLSSKGYEMPVITTPDELMGE
jgi:predicted nucleic acid-binding protein